MGILQEVGKSCDRWKCKVAIAGELTERREVLTEVIEEFSGQWERSKIKKYGMVNAH